MFHVLVNSALIGLWPWWVGTSVHLQVYSLSSSAATSRLLDHGICSTTGIFELPTNNTRLYYQWFTKIFIIYTSFPGIY
jgi:hypothetical protein